MTSLLDVNVLIALAWPNHVHHSDAHSWFRSNQHHGWATCPLTESGFVRVSSNPRVSISAHTPMDAIAVLRLIREVPGHVFWDDDVSPANPSLTPFGRVVGYRQVTDAHLLALAISRNGRLVTFDRRLTALAGPDERRALDIIGFA